MLLPSKWQKCPIYRTSAEFSVVWGFLPLPQKSPALRWQILYELYNQFLERLYCLNIYLSHAPPFKVAEMPYIPHKCRVFSGLGISSIASEVARIAMANTL